MRSFVFSTPYHKANILSQCANAALHIWPVTEGRIFPCKLIMSSCLMISEPSHWLIRFFWADFASLACCVNTVMSLCPSPPPRLLCSLYSGLSLLRVLDSVQHRAGLRHLRLLRRRRLVLLLLLCVGGVRWLWPALWHGLWHHWRLLWVCRLPGDLHGVLQPLLLLLRPPRRRHHHHHRRRPILTHTSSETTPTSIFPGAERRYMQSLLPGLCVWHYIGWPSWLHNMSSVSYRVCQVKDVT